MIKNISNILCSFIIILYGSSSYSSFEDLESSGNLTSDISAVRSRLGGSTLMGGTNTICGKVVDTLTADPDLDVVTQLSSLQAIVGGDTVDDIETQAAEILELLGALDSYNPPSCIIEAVEEEIEAVTVIANRVLDTPSETYDDLASAVTAAGVGVGQVVSDLSISVSIDPDEVDRTPLNAVAYLKALIGGNETLSIEEILLDLKGLVGGDTGLSLEGMLLAQIDRGPGDTVDEVITGALS
ncbi:hypothetical protein OAN21_02760 [Alphaproteobacteria bacterium]|nr:hypothetical protein [Alphaproteobacteria bacterium]